MRKTAGLFLLLTGLSLATMTATAWQAQQPRPVNSTTAAPPMSPEEAIKAFRSDLQMSRADIIAKNVTLSADQAAKFWPVFNKYMEEQSAILDDQLKGVQRYAQNYDSIDDATALVLMNAHFDRDARMNSLRQRYLGELQKVLPTRLAVRAMQIDRRISLMQQVEIASQIPLVH